MSTAIRPAEKYAQGPRRFASPQSIAARTSVGKLAPLLIVFYSFLLFPPEVAFSLAGLNFPSYRLALLAMVLPTVALILNNPRFRINAIDIAIGLASCWILLSFSMIYGLQVGFVRGSGILFDFFLPYLVARACIQSPNDIRYFLVLCLPGLAFAGGAMAIESLSGQLLLRPAFASVFGNVSQFSGGEEVGSLVLRQDFRLGLLRGYGPFSHPILGGAVLASFLPLYFFSGLRSWPFLLGLLVAFAGFFSLSSAALLALMIGVAAIIVDTCKRYLPQLSWWLIVLATGAGVSIVHLASTNGIIGVIARLTFSPGTASYRRLIWQFGLENVWKNPWFGLGYQQWERLYWMGESVDAHFLLLAMRHGLPVSLLLLLAMLYGAVALGMKLNVLQGKDRQFMIGINVSIAAIFITAQTVNFFGSASIVFMSMLGFLASMIVWIDGRTFEQQSLSRRQTVSRTQHEPGMARLDIQSKENGLHRATRQQ